MVQDVHCRLGRLADACRQGLTACGRELALRQMLRQRATTLLLGCQAPYFQPAHAADSLTTFLHQERRSAVFPEAHWGRTLPRALDWQLCFLFVSRGFQQIVLMAAAHLLGDECQAAFLASTSTNNSCVSVPFLTGRQGMRSGMTLINHRLWFPFRTAGFIPTFPTEHQQVFFSSFTRPCFVFGYA